METKFSLEIVLSTLRSLLNSVKWLVKKVPILIWKSIAVVTLVLMGSAITAWVVVKATAQPAPVAAPGPSWILIGGLDAQKYCQTSGYVRMDMNMENGAIHCSSVIELDDACNWTYKSTGMKFELKDRTNSRSGICYDSSGTEVGGIPNMTGYCQSKPTSGEPRGVDPGGTWMCQFAANSNVACKSQYSEESAEARWDKEIKELTCWAKRNADPAM